MGELLILGRYRDGMLGRWPDLFRSFGVTGDRFFGLFGAAFWILSAH
jgi:hypothetical protein